MKKLLKDLGVYVLMFTMVFAIVYIITISADEQYEINQEKERIYFERVKEMRR